MSGVIICASLGAFVGGQNVIGSYVAEEEEEEEEEEEGMEGMEVEATTATDTMNYLWLLILTVATVLLWHCVIDGSKRKFLSGYAGRLGTTTFLGMNVVMLFIYGPLGVVNWDRYYGGFVEYRDAEWWDMTDLTVAICHVLASLYLGMLSGGTRLLHERRRLLSSSSSPSSSSSSSSSRVNDNGEDTSSLIMISHPLPPPPQPTTSGPPLNNVLVPALYALLSMLLAYCYPAMHARRHYYDERVIPALFDGFAVGSFVGMASLQRIPSMTKFLMVSFLASIWGLTLTPLFVGFAGKSGFTATLGHLTQDALESIVRRTRAGLQRRSRREEENRREESHEEDDEEQRGLQLAGHLNSAASRPRSSLGRDKLEDCPVEGRDEDDETMVLPPSPPRHGQYKPRRETYYTKQQRRQSQRLRHHLMRKGSDSSKVTMEDRPSPLKLHRAWSALPVDGDDGVWHHSLKSQLD
ncbi:hypothetical protein ACHAXA_003855 [Cyclostephanos tholiformis]|uniref:Uncharacterized protein n=1 Tax=Cyclostephanos tholiformis TaxID=382380 RepID=A0ABD3RWR7_9STRA